MDNHVKSFDDTQSSFVRLRDILSEQSRPVVFWVGAGLSMSAGLPSWKQLEQHLIAELESKIRNTDRENKADSLGNKLSIAKTEKDIWKAFSILEGALGSTVFSTVIRKNLEPSNSLEIPSIYRTVWSFKGASVVSLNIDQFASRAYTLCHPGKVLNRCTGKELNDKMHFFQSPHQLLLEMHGATDVPKSWVFTDGDRNSLSRSKAYKMALDVIFASKVVVFLGISAMDVAAGGPIHRIRVENKLSLGEHFWFTHQDREEVDSWCEESGVQLVKYQASGGDHSQLDGALRAILDYLPTEPIPKPIVPDVVAQCAVTIPTPAEVAQLPTAEMRDVLNQESKRILADESPGCIERYERFRSQYAEAIYRAWFIPDSPQDYGFLSVIITEKVASGSFGTVYRATNQDGDQLAVKILHHSRQDSPEWLHSFRRGARSMKILTSEKIEGTVRYHSAVEIPATIVMDFVEGCNLEDAVSRGAVKSWSDVLAISERLVRIIRNSHSLPERVLHRDIRPSNILLRNLFDRSIDWSIVDLLLADYDLSWHKGSIETTLNQSSSMSGYLAPEQINPTKSTPTRSAAVDSFGLGMTLFFIRGGHHPRPGQHKFSDWEDQLKVMAKENVCKEWVSIPNRYSRLIKNCTYEIQPRRWNVSQILDELARLNICLLEGTSRSAELIAEEIMVRACRGGDYHWDEDRFTAIYRVGEVKIEIQGRESEQILEVRWEWLDSERATTSSTRKYVLSKSDQASSLFKIPGWTTTKSSRSDQFKGSAKASIYQVSADITKVSRTVESLIDRCSVK